MEVLVTVTGLDKINRHFDAFERNLTSEETMAKVGEEIKSYNEKRWGKGIKDAPTTALRWPEGTPLNNPQAAQELGKPGLQSTFRIKEVTPTSVTYGTDDFRARLLQYGTVKMVKKRVLRLPRKAVKAILSSALLRGTRG